MIAEDQAEIIDFLASPKTHDGISVERIETHTAVVFLAGKRAYKLKRAVRFDYVDFSTLDRRHHSCDEEVRLNRRTAASLYTGVIPVTRHSSGALALGGKGPVVEWLVEMKRFDQDRLFDRLVAADQLGIDLMAPLAAAIANLHRVAERRTDHGGRTGMAWVVEGNAASFVELGAAGLDATSCAALTDDARTELDRHGAFLDERRQAGRVRECHGDLHLRNIVLIDGHPTLFDAVDFNEEISCIDVIYDLAFLLMDLWRRQLPCHANLVLNHYMAETVDLEALRLLPLFLSCRAAVRAKTSATAAPMQRDAIRRRELQALAREYLAMAGQLLRPSRPSLVAIGGFSGTGKSTLAVAIAPRLGAAPGAIVLRSDEIRKRLCGVTFLQRLGPEAYSPEVSNRVYDTLLRHARIAIRNGHSAIVDAVFPEPAQRDAIERIAAELAVPFVGWWLTAPESLLIDRVEHRCNDPSDADAAVIRQQHKRNTGAIAWHSMDTSLPCEAVIDSAIARLRLQLPEACLRPPVS